MIHRQNLARLEDWIAVSGPWNNPHSDSYRGDVMKEDDLRLLHDLLTSQRVLALAVLVEGKPHVGLLPYALKDDFSAAIIHVSALARHSKGLAPGLPFSIAIHFPDRPDLDPLQLPRVLLEGEVAVLDRGTREYGFSRAAFLKRFPSSDQTFSLGDFQLCELRFRAGRLIGGFARASTVSERILRDLASRYGPAA